MEEGLGQLGFWLMVGMVVAAAIVSGAIKARDKERERQATLRALLSKEATAVSEVLAYLRDRDAEEAAAAARVRAGSDALTRRWKRRGKVAAAIFAFALGIYAFGAVRYGLMHGTGSLLPPIAALVAIWAVGLLIAGPVWRSATQSNDAHPGA